MEFTYHYERQEPQQLKYFLKEQGISKGLLAKIKFQGGKIFVNDQRQNVLYSLVQNDTVTIVIPDEGEHETVLLDETPIEIVYEDQHLLIVNKPAGIASIPAQYHPNGTMANRVKAYYKQQGYQDQVIHVVTRLDRDTSGLMLFAKHGFAHAKLDVQLRQKQLIKISSNRCGTDSRIGFSRRNHLSDCTRSQFIIKTKNKFGREIRTYGILVDEKGSASCCGYDSSSYRSYPSDSRSFCCHPLSITGR